MHGGVGHHWFDQIETYDSRQRVISALTDNSEIPDTYDKHIIAKRIVKNRVDHSFLFWRNQDDGTQKLVIYGGRDHEKSDKVPQQIDPSSPQETKKMNCKAIR